MSPSLLGECLSGVPVPAKCSGFHTGLRALQIFLLLIFSFEATSRIVFLTPVADIEELMETSC